MAREGLVIPSVAQQVAAQAEKEMYWRMVRNQWLGEMMASLLPKFVGTELNEEGYLVIGSKFEFADIARIATDATDALLAAQGINFKRVNEVKKDVQVGNKRECEAPDPERYM